VPGGAPYGRTEYGRPRRSRERFTGGVKGLTIDSPRLRPARHRWAARVGRTETHRRLSTTRNVAPPPQSPLVKTSPLRRSHLSSSTQRTNSPVNEALLHMAARTCAPGDGSRWLQYTAPIRAIEQLGRGEEKRETQQIVRMLSVAPVVIRLYGHTAIRRSGSVAAALTHAPPVIGVAQSARRYG